MEDRPGTDTAEAETDSPAESPADTSAPRFICDRCGTPMIERNCKVVCPNCGNRFDCSDLSLYFD